ncbi:hypothetical protein FRACA_180055 [Frankia canadensis]|uniref:Uncharacterized protein n=1 Tax=Frankia canadensis TaxID=1836972 RepID=A0A2I2KNP5_9ACTN|nr:hypothetical protein FRACA_180055 [Frankia canadensis]SOU54581.1 hypothetical protein FRACA_180055 [Frankia canadensis]
MESSRIKGSQVNFSSIKVRADNCEIIRK